MAQITIQEGDTLSALAAKNKTTVSELARLNNISNPDVIQTGASLRLPETNTNAFSATDVVEKSPLAFADGVADTSSIDSIFDLTAGTKGINDQIQKQFEDNQTRLDELDAEKEEAKTTRKTTREKIEGLIFNRPDSSDLLEREREALGIGEDLNLSRSLIGDIEGLRSQLAVLDTEGTLAVEKLSGQGRGIPLSIIRGQQAKTQRQNAIRRAGVAAELGAKSSTLQALNGNIALASKLANSAVEAELFDISQELKDYNDLFDLNEDIINDLDTETKELLETNRTEIQNRLDNAREEKQQVAQLMIDNPSVNISIGDTLDEASQKVANAGGSLAARREQRLGDTAVDTTTSFTDTQENKGSSKSGIPIAEFKTLSADVKNYFINSPKDNVDTVNEVFVDIANGDADPQDEKDEIDESNLSQPVKDYIKNRIDSIAVDALADGGGSGLGSKAWSGIKFLLGLN